jgi:hypothetical protein
MTGSDEIIEHNNANLNLIIKKKMIIDTQHHHILESERKCLMYE